MQLQNGCLKRNKVNEKNAMAETGCCVLFFIYHPMLLEKPSFFIAEGLHFETMAKYVELNETYL